MTTRKVWKCECGNEDQTKVVTPPDGEVICGECGTVLGQVQIEETREQTDGWDGEADLCRKLLEERVSRRGWQF